MTDRFTIEIVPSPVYEIELTGRGPQGMQGPKGDTGATGPAGPAGPQGLKGDKGDSALTFVVGETIELPTSNSAYVENVGTNQDIVLDFGIPRGLTGASGKGVDIGSIIQSLSKVAPDGFVHTWGESISQEENPDLYQACVDGTLPTVNASNGGVSTIYAPNGIFKQTPSSNTFDINTDVVMELAKIGGVVDWNGSYNPQPTGNITLASLSQNTETQILMFTEGGQNEVHFRFLEGSYSGKLAEAPSNPSNNTLYFNTTDKTYYIYEGGDWNQYGASGVGYIYLGGIVVTSNPATATWNDVGFIPADTTTTGLSEYDQQLVANKGNCGYFGLDTTELSVRVPTMQNVFLEENDTEVGSYKEAGLPNITGSGKSTYWFEPISGTMTGAFKNNGDNSGKTPSQAGSSTGYTGLEFDASLSNPIYGNSDTVQPEAIAVYFYVCVSKYTSLEQGPYFTPHIDSNGVLSWTNNGGLVNPPNVDIKGPKGDNAFTLSIGEVTTLPSGAEASVTNVGTASDQIWDIAIPEGFGFSLGDLVQKDHVLSFEESEGLALLGTYVYKNGVAGSRYGYPDFYNKYLEEYQDSVLVENPWTQPILSSNGTLGGDSFACFSSSEHSSPYVAYKAFNGNISDLTSTETYWCSKAKTGTQFIGFYNPEPIRVTALRLYNNRGSQNDGVIATAIIQGSNDNTIYTDLGTFSGNTYGTTYIDVDLSSNTSFYKYYRIVANTYTGNYATMGEVVITATIKSAYYQNANGHKFYPISQKSYFDELFESTGVAWYYGIDEENERIFLPRNDWFFQSGSTVNVGEFNEGLVKFDLPLDGNYPTTGGVSNAKGYLASPQDGADGHTVVYKVEGTRTFNINNVQPPSVNQIVYMVVGNTTTEKAQTEVTEITTSENDTLPLFHNFYSQEDMTTTGAYVNASLGSWLSGNVYSTAYNELVNKLGTGNVKANTDSYTDYDFVVNQDDMTFRLPLLNGERVLVEKKEPTELDPTWYNLYNDGWCEQGGQSTANTTVRTVNFVKPFVNANYYASATKYGDYRGTNAVVSMIATKSANSMEINNAATDYPTCMWQAKGYTDIPTNTGVNLYYKLSNAVTNIEILDVAKVTADLNTKISRTELKAYIVETYVNGASWYRVYSDGWCEQGSFYSSNGTQDITINLLKEFANTAYTLMITNKRSSSSTTSVEIKELGYYTKTVSSFSKYCSSNTGYDVGFDWQACGYIA